MGLPDLIDKYLELQSRPELFSEPYKLKPPIYEISRPERRELKEVSLRCAVCTQRAIPGCNYCPHHFALTGKVAKCAFFGCEEPAIGGLYSDAIGISYCEMHQNQANEPLPAKCEHGTNVTLEEEREMGFKEPGFFEATERINLSLTTAEQLVHSWVHQLLLKIRLDQ